ncbi:aminotriazole resistance protein [Penicillium cf. viridicatum]|uniref:Aminotriazole resistance protein n=1 Tax=Penicillium cf. viridicatum TaxID=2972119 RepID=A0A9W9IP19_9EURO|nr:aminotriazole resistance protein [Penicillium cf. viridicatum]
MGQGPAVLDMIGDQFHVTSNGELSWYMASFSLTTGTLIPVAGRLGDMYGSKPILVGGLVTYAVWSFVAGASYFLRTSDKLFIVARALQGMGASLVLPNAVAIIGRTHPIGKRKAMVFSLFGAFAPGGYMLGALFTAIPAQFSI